MADGVERLVRRRFAERSAFGACILVSVLLVGVVGCGGSESASTSAPAVGAGPRSYDLQGHRGARGLRPENTLPAFELALDLMVDTLEFDLQLSADGVVIVWHDPVIDADTCAIDGAPTRIRELTAAELTDIRCDRNPDPDRFPDQLAAPGALAGDDYRLASLADVFEFVDAYVGSDAKSGAQRANAAAVRFSIETKRRPDDPSAIDDGFDGETIGVFETALIATAGAAGVLDRVTVQSFDLRSLWAIHAVAPEISLAALTERDVTPDFTELAARGATIWSPDYRNITTGTLAEAHRAGLLVVPWTVNDPDDMADLLELGIDGIITDRPDLAPPRWR